MECFAIETKMFQILFLKSFLKLHIKISKTLRWDSEKKMKITTKTIALEKQIKMQQQKGCDWPSKIGQE